MDPSCGFLAIAIVAIPPLVVPEVLGLAVAVFEPLPPQPASATRAARAAGRAARASRVLVIISVSLVFGQTCSNDRTRPAPTLGEQSASSAARRVGLVLDGSASDLWGQTRRIG